MGRATSFSSILKRLGRTTPCSANEVFMSTKGGNEDTRNESHSHKVKQLGKTTTCSADQRVTHLEEINQIKNITAENLCTNIVDINRININENTKKEVSTSEESSSTKSSEKQINLGNAIKIENEDIKNESDLHQINFELETIEDKQAKGIDIVNEAVEQVCKMSCIHKLMDEQAVRLKISIQEINLPPFSSSASHEAFKNLNQPNSTLYTMVAHQISPFLVNPLTKLYLSNISVSFPSHYINMDISRQTTNAVAQDVHHYNPVSEIPMVAHKVSENDAEITEDQFSMSAHSIQPNGSENRQQSIILNKEYNECAPDEGNEEIQTTFVSPVINVTCVHKFLDTNFNLHDAESVQAPTFSSILKRLGSTTDKSVRNIKENTKDENEVAENVCTRVDINEDTQEDLSIHEELYSTNAFTDSIKIRNEPDSEEGINLDSRVKIIDEKCKALESILKEFITDIKVEKKTIVEENYDLECTQESILEAEAGESVDDNIKANELDDCYEISIIEDSSKEPYENDEEGKSQLEEHYSLELPETEVYVSVEIGETLEGNSTNKKYSQVQQILEEFLRETDNDEIEQANQSITDIKEEKKTIVDENYDLECIQSILKAEALYDLFTIEHIDTTIEHVENNVKILESDKAVEFESEYHVFDKYIYEDGEQDVLYEAGESVDESIKANELEDCYQISIIEDSSKESYGNDKEGKSQLEEQYSLELPETEVYDNVEIAETLEDNKITNIDSSTNTKYSQVQQILEEFRREEDVLYKAGESVDENIKANEMEDCYQISFIEDSLKECDENDKEGKSQLEEQYSLELPETEVYLSVEIGETLEDNKITEIDSSTNKKYSQVQQILEEFLREEDDDELEQANQLLFETRELTDENKIIVELEDMYEVSVLEETEREPIEDCHLY